MTESVLVSVLDDHYLVSDEQGEKIAEGIVEDIKDGLDPNICQFWIHNSCITVGHEGKIKLSPIDAVTPFKAEPLENGRNYKVTRKSIEICEN